MTRGRAYLRVLPESFARKAFGLRDAKGKLTRDPYPPAAVAAFYGVLCLAEHQPERGRFGSLRVVKALLEGPNGEGRLYARQVPYLVEHRDLIVRPGGSVYVDGWDELQEGDIDVPARMRRYRDRLKPDGPGGSYGDPEPTVTAGVTKTVTPSSVTRPRESDGGQRNHPSTASRSLGRQRTSGEQRAENGSPSRDPAVRPERTWLDDDPPEAPALSWLATHGAALEPNGNGLHRKLCRLVETKGWPVVQAAFEALALESTEARQFVFGADNRLNQIPGAPPGEKPEDRSLREMQERIEARRKAKEATS